MDLKFRKILSSYNLPANSFERSRLFPKSAFIDVKREFIKGKKMINKMNWRKGQTFDNLIQDFSAKKNDNCS